MTEMPLKPLVTEKSAQSGVYAFAVPASANKPLIRAEIKRRYNVVPVKVNIVNVAGKRVVVRGRYGEQQGMKKALVYLKKGDKITTS